MGDYFSSQKIGGQVNSLISNQDSLAIVYAIEQLYNADMFGFGINVDDFSLQCETDDDLCIVNQNNKIFIQLKSSKITATEFYKIMDNFINNSLNEKRNCFFVISTFKDFKIESKDIITRINSYRNILQDPNETEDKKINVKNELISDFGLKNYKDIIDRIKIDTRPLFRDDKDVKAIFSRYLRLAYGLRDLKEKLIDDIYDGLMKEIESARRNRGIIRREIIESIIGKNLVKDTMFNKLDLLIGYERVENGYKKKEIDNAKLLFVEKARRKVVRNIFRNWRRIYFKEFFVSMFVGAKKCPECGHPMTANLYGLKGIACPRCGYLPYVTIFVVCNCGNYELIKAQPELIDSKVFTYLNDFYNKYRKCSKCGNDLIDEYFEFRVFFLPLPYPLENYKNINQIYVNSKY